MAEWGSRFVILMMGWFLQPMKKAHKFSDSCAPTFSLPAHRPALQKKNFPNSFIHSAALQSGRGEARPPDPMPSGSGSRGRRPLPAAAPVVQVSSSGSGEEGSDEEEEEEEEEEGSEGPGEGSMGRGGSATEDKAAESEGEAEDPCLPSCPICMVAWTADGAHRVR